MVATVTASGAQEALNGAGGDIVLNIPTGFVATEVELRWLVAAGTGSAANLTPVTGTGFTSIANNGLLNDYGERAVYRVHTGTPGSVTHTIAATESLSLGYGCRAQGVDTSDVLAGTGTTGEIASAASPATLPTITTDVAGATIVYMVFHGLGTATPTMSVPTLKDTFWLSGVDLGACYTEVQAVAGASTARQVAWTGGSSSPIYYTIFALNPAATAPDAPAQPTVQAGPECVLVEWVAPAGTPTGYKIERNINAAGWTTLVADTANTKVWYLDQGRTNGTTIQYRISGINAIGTSSASTASADATPAFKAIATAVDGTGRWITDQNGDFWPMLGDSGGLWPQFVNNATIITYLDNMAQRRFNLWRIKPIEYGTPDAGATHPLYQDTVTGTAPFATGPYAGAINSAYWDRVEWYTSQALVRGITLWFTPIYLGITDDEGVRDEIAALTNTDMTNRGTEIGARMATYPNVIWVYGGDMSAAGTTLTRQDAFINGMQTSLAAVSRSHLMTVHGAPDSISADVGNFTDLTSGWRLNGVYDNTETEVTEYGAAWADNAGPVFLMEGFYRYNPAPPTLQQMRRQNWWGLMAGSGAVMGNMDRVQWGQNITQAPVGTLAQTWEHTGDRDDDTSDFVVMIDWVHVWRTRLDGTALDTTGAFLVSGASSLTTGALARYGVGLGIVYMPTTRAVDLDVTRVATTCQILRIDPVSGATSVLTTSATSSAHTVASQGNNSSGDSDWILVVTPTPIPALRSPIRSTLRPR